MISYAQNFEDVMLWRALKHVSQGCYIDIGAWDPVHDSVSMTFYEQGWRGVHVEPVEKCAKKLRDARPDEIVIQAAVGNSDKAANFFLFEVTGLSTLNSDIAGRHTKNGFSVTSIEVPIRTLESIFTEVEGREIHWLKIDVEGMEESVIQSWNKSPVRPWVVVVESTIPLSQIEVSAGKEELNKLGYSLAYFDGINRFYVHDSRSELLTFFRFGPNVFDRFLHFNSVRNPQDPEHQNLTNLVQQAEGGLLEPSTQIGASKNVIEECKVQAAQNASQIQDSVVAPSSYLVPGPFSWYSYLYKMLHIKKLTIPNENKTSEAAYKGPGFWRRLERSIRKRRKRLFGRIGFDWEWYLQEYPEVGSSGIDPLDHWLRFGVEEGRWKSRRHKEKAIASGTLREKRPDFFRRLEISIRKRRKRWTNYWTFDPAWYLEVYPEVRVAGVEPLDHYLSFGKKEGKHKRASEKDLIKVIKKAFKKSCGFQTKGKANCSLNVIEGPWWILEAKIERPDGYWGACGLRIRIGGREVHLDRTDAVAGGIVHLRHLLKLPIGENNIRLDWVDEGISSQKILEKTCHIKGVFRVDQEKILVHPVDGQTNMTLAPKYGLLRSMEKWARKRRKTILLFFQKLFKDSLPIRSNETQITIIPDSKSNKLRLFADITSIVGSDRLTGIERVTKTVLARLEASKTHSMEIIPIYSVENQQGFFKAKSSTERNGRWDRGLKGEEAVQLSDGDVFLGLALNSAGISANANLLRQWADQGVSILFYVYDLLPIQYPQFWPLEAQMDILHHEWLSIVTSFDEVICISETTAKRCREFLDGKYPPRFSYRSQLQRASARLGSRKAEISVIQLGCDFESEPLSQGLPGNAEELLQKFRSKPTFLMVGTLEPRKGHRQMLTVFEQLWDEAEEVQLVIVGRNGWLMEDFVADLEKHPERGQKLFWLDAVSDEFLSKIYEACGCLLAGSIDEGFGLPIVEAMKKGKLILARDIDVFREILGDGGWFFNEGKDQIKEKIIKLKSPQKLKKKSSLSLWEEHIKKLQSRIKNSTRQFIGENNFEPNMGRAKRTVQNIDITKWNSDSTSGAREQMRAVRNIVRSISQEKYY